MSFSQNVALVAITAAITGLLIPTVKAFMDWRQFKRQKSYEAELLRQTSIIDAQVKLLEDLADLLWEYVLSLIEVSYYAVNRHGTRHAEATKAYEEKAGARLGRMQAEFSKARRLVPPERLDALQDLYRTFLRLDLGVSRLRGSDDHEAWSQHHREAFDTQVQIIRVLGHLAADLRLVAPGAAPGLDPAPHAQAPLWDPRPRQPPP